MSKRDYYDILEVDKGASEAELKKAYRKVAIKFHPDKNPDDASAEEKFKEAAEAYDVLSNPQKKQRYDQYGHAGVGGAASGGGGFGGGGMNMDDIFSHFGDIFGGGGFGGGGDRFAGGAGGTATASATTFFVTRRDAAALRGAGAPHRVCRCGSFRSHLIGSRSGSTV